MKNLGQMLKQAQQMQSRMEDMQKILEAMEVEGQAGAGAVRVVLNGKGVLKSVRIDPELFAFEDKDVVEDMIVAAHNEAKTINDRGFGLAPGDEASVLA